MSSVTGQMSDLLFQLQSMPPLTFQVSFSQIRKLIESLSHPADELLGYGHGRGLWGHRGRGHT